YKLRGIVNHGMYERYHHDVVGVNSRLDSMQAVVLRAKLPNLDSYNKARRKAARLYSEKLAGLENVITPTGVKDSTTDEYGICENHVFHQYTLRLKKTDSVAVVAYLNSEDVPGSAVAPTTLKKLKA